MAPAAAPVARGAWIRTRRIRPDFQQAKRVHTGNAAPARADLDHFDHGHAHGQAATLFKAVDACDLEVGRDERFAALDQARFRGGAAHIETEQVRALRRVAVIRGGEGTGGRPGLNQADRVAAGDLHRRRAAATEHHEQRRARDAEFIQPCHEIGEVLLHQRAHVDIGERSARALVLADFRHHFTRQRDDQFRRKFREGCAQLPLVIGVAVRVHQADCDGLRTKRAQLCDEIRNLRRVERCPYRAIRKHALVDAEATTARREGRGHLDEEVVQVVPALRGESLPRRGSPRWRVAP